MPETDDRYDQVIAALDRLARGRFARCDVCGGDIDDNRLRVAADADRCDRHRRDGDRTTPGPPSP